jgi:hypothetical protein
MTNAKRVDKGSESRYRGRAGEQAFASLLSRLRINSFEPDVDWGIDRVALAGNHPGLFFAFQVKTNETASIPIEAGTFRMWLGHLRGGTPVFVVHVRLSGKPNDDEFRLLVLYEWMLKHPDWNARLSQGRITFRLEEFTAVRTVKDGDTGEDENTFVQSMESEAARVKGESWALWRATPSLEVPISDLELYENFGVLAQIEATKRDIDEALKRFRSQCPSAIGSDAIGAIRELVLRRRSEVDGKLAEFLEREEFRRFVDAMILGPAKYAESIPMFSHAQVKCWRVFAQIFPASMQIFDYVVEHAGSFRDEQVMAVSLIISSASALSDEVRSGHAVDLSRKLKGRLLGALSRAGSYAEFRLANQILYSANEAEGTSESTEAVLNYLRNAPLEWLIRHNCEYYGDPTVRSMVRTLRDKISNPRPRDDRTKRISYAHQEGVAKWIRDRGLRVGARED